MNEKVNPLGDEINQATRTLVRQYFDDINACFCDGGSGEITVANLSRLHGEEILKAGGTVTTRYKEDGEGNKIMIDGYEISENLNATNRHSMISGLSNESWEKMGFKVTAKDDAGE